MRARARDVCTRAMLLYFVGRARCRCVGALATGYFWFHIPAGCIFGRAARARRARAFRFSREKKEGLRERGEVEFVPGTRRRKRVSVPRADT